MAQRVALGILGLAVVVLGGVVFAQHRQLDRLDGELEALRTREPRSSSLSKLRSTFASATTINAATRTEPEAPPPKPAQRVPVTRDDLSRVESAMLNLLENDHPELREKLRALVQEQQQGLQEQRREARRERWAARREAKLLSLTETAGITPEQRESILTIMLSNRDQIDELRRDARTPEQIATLRERIAAVREQGNAQIQKQLNAQQYEAYRGQFETDDDDRSRERTAP